MSKHVLDELLSLGAQLVERSAHLGITVLAVAPLACTGRFKQELIDRVWAVTLVGVFNQSVAISDLFNLALFLTDLGVACSKAVGESLGSAQTQSLSTLDQIVCKDGVVKVLATQITKSSSQILDRLLGLFGQLGNVAVDQPLGAARSNL